MAALPGEPVVDVGGLRWRSPRGVVAFSALVGLGIGIGGVSAGIGLAAFGIGAWCVLRGAASRFAVVGFGGLLVLQSSQELTSGKILYGGVVAFSVAVAAVELRREGHLASRGGRRLSLAAAAMASVCLVSGMAATLQGTPVSSWFRDITPYLLLAGAPLLALDLGVHSPRARIVALLVLLTAAGGLSVSLEWVARRGLWEAVAGGAFASFLLGAAGFAYAVAAASRRHPIPWSLYAAALFALAMGTGTRSVLVWLAAPLVVAADSLHRSPRRLEGGLRPARLVVTSFLGASVGFVLIGMGLEQAGWPVRDAFARVVSLDQVAGGVDQSLVERVAQYRVAWTSFLAHPLLGVGPGTVFEWVVPWVAPIGSVVKIGWSMDTPLTLIAKFGLLGSGAFVSALVMLLRTMREQPAWASDVNRLAIKAYGAVLVLHLPLGNPLEDKGLALAAMPLLALVFHGTGMSGRSRLGMAGARGSEEVGRNVAVGVRSRATRSARSRLGGWSHPDVD